MTALRHKGYRILVVDDEPEILAIISEMLSSSNFRCDTASKGREALDILRRHQYDLLITDVRLPDISGIDILRIVGKKYPLMPVIVVTGFASIESTKEAMRLGAVDYIPKPFSAQAVLSSVEHILASSMYVTRKGGTHQIIYRSKNMENVIDLVRKVSKTDSTVLITGESGTGKELFARSLHQMSYRSGQQFVSVNSGGVPEGLLESELFGHRKGSYTGAIATTLGRFQIADGGTLFLDEVGNMSHAMQVKLLRVLQEGEFTPVGDTESQKVDIRLIAATNRNLDEAVEKGDFREDLFYRLNVIDIHVPPLRHRKEDIILIANHFLELYSGQSESEQFSLGPDAATCLLSYSWPGNVRELANAIERATVLCDGYVISSGDFPARITGQIMLPPGELEQNGQLDLPSILESTERNYIMHALLRCKGVRAATARMLGLKRTTLLASMKRLSIPEETGRKS
jgi:two-component system NtrC family response regulator